VAGDAATPAAAELPFTGTDVRLLVTLGVALILAGLYIITTIEQRRRTVRRMARAAQTSAVGEQATRVSQWLLGE